MQFHTFERSRVSSLKTNQDPELHKRHKKYSHHTVLEISNVIFF